MSKVAIRDTSFPFAAEILAKVASGVCLIDSRLTILYENELMCRWFGDHAGRNISDVAEGFPCGRSFSICERTFTSNRDIVAEMSFVINGKTHYFIVKSSIFHLEGSSGPCCLETFEDITSLKSAQIDLRENRRMLATLLKNLPGMAYRCKLDRDYSMEFISLGCRDLTGYAPEDLIDNERLSYAEIIHPDDRDYVWECVDQGVRANRPFQMEYRIIDSAGAEKHVWERGCLVFTKGQEEPYLEGFILDITKRVEAEAMLRQSEKMEALGQLAGGIAHDFNNNLSGIIAYADLLLERVDDEKLSHYIKGILRCGERSGQLTNSLLNFSRKGKKGMEMLNLHEIIEDTAELLKHSIDKRIRIELELGATLPFVLGNASQLQNVFINMGINSSHAMPGGGKLWFSTSDLFLSESPAEQVFDNFMPGKYLLVEVRDTGCGMDEKILAKIFEPFFTTKKEGAGTGLGLAASRGAVQEHNGFINVASTLGEGTAFRVYLPVCERHFRSHEENGKPESVHGTANIIVVDDEEMVLGATSELLESIGYSVCGFTKPGEALDYFSKNHAVVDLVVADLIMPEMDGFEMVKKMHEIHPGIKVVFITGTCCLLHERAESLSPPPQVVEKPVTKGTLFRIISKELES